MWPSNSYAPPPNPSSWIQPTQPQHARSSSVVGGQQQPPYNVQRPMAHQNDVWRPATTNVNNNPYQAVSGSNAWSPQQQQQHQQHPSIQVGYGPPVTVAAAAGNSPRYLQPPQQTAQPSQEQQQQQQEHTSAPQSYHHHHHHHHHHQQLSYHQEAAAHHHDDNATIHPSSHQHTIQTFEEYCKLNALENMKRGTFFLPKWSRSTNVSLPSPSPSPSTSAVDLGVWNSYWGTFSEAICDHEDEVRQMLKDQELGTGSAMGAGPGKQNKRRAVIKYKHGIDVLDVHHLINTSLQFGAIEWVRVVTDEIRIQFTTAEAALAFLSVARSIDHSVLLSGKNPFAPSVKRRREDGSAASGGGGGGEKTIFLVDQKASTAHPKTLRLGNNLEIASVYLNALFRDLFDAQGINYQQGVFFIQFSSYETAKYALHVLQQSFYHVFGLSLTFWENSGDNQKLAEFLGETNKKSVTR